MTLCRNPPLLLKRIKTCLWGWKSRTNYNGMINRTVQSAEAFEQAITYQWLNPYKGILLLVQISGYWIHSLVTNCHRVGWWLNNSFPFCLFLLQYIVLQGFKSSVFINIYPQKPIIAKRLVIYTLKAAVENMFFFFSISRIIACTLDKINFYLQLGLSTATVTNQISMMERIHWDLLWAPLHFGLMSVFHSLLIAISYLGDLNNSHW